ncbi:MAG: cell division protein FtsK, partial [Bacteroidetes bacterium]
MTTRGKTQNTKNLDRKKSFTINKNTQYVIGLFLLFFTFYLLVSFLSFLFYGGMDQSQLDIASSEFIFNPEVQVENFGGKEGAYLSQLFINNGVGLSAFFLLGILFLFSLRLLHIRPFSLLKSSLLLVSVTILGSLALSFFLVDSYQDSHLAIGGLHGYYVTHWLNAAIGKLGTFLLLLLGFICILTFSIRDLLGKTKNAAQKMMEKKVQIFPKKEKQEAPEEENSIIKEETNTITTAEGFSTATDNEINLPDHDRELLLADKNTEDISVEDMEVTVSKQDETVEAPLEDYDPTLDLSQYKKPTIDLLKEYPENKEKVTGEELEENKNKIVETLRHYGIEITQIKATIGPTITLYEIIPAPGVRISKIKNLEDDIALSLAALGIRIIAPIPGKGTIGIEVPNKTPEIVSMHGVVLSKKFQEAKYELPIVIGRTISNESFVFDLTKMPHLLVAGATGQGKSVGMNAIITSLLYKKHPSQLKFVMVDPKMVEFSI